MKLLILTNALMLSGAVSAAECYTAGGSSNCVTRNGLLDFRNQFCSDHWGGNFAEVTYTDGANRNLARFSHSGNFRSQADCWDSTRMFDRSCC